MLHAGMDSKGHTLRDTVLYSQDCHEVCRSVVSVCRRAGNSINAWQALSESARYKPFAPSASSAW